MSNYSIVLAGSVPLARNSEVLVESFQKTGVFRSQVHYKVTDLRRGIVYAPAGLYGAEMIDLVAPRPTQELTSCVCNFRGFARVLACRVLSSDSHNGVGAQTELQLEPIAAPSP